jgi:hypothetical protein
MQIRSVDIGLGKRTFHLVALSTADKVLKCPCCFSLEKYRKIERS